MCFKENPIKSKVCNDFGKKRTARKGMRMKFSKLRRMRCMRNMPILRIRRDIEELGKVLSSQVIGWEKKPGNVFFVMILTESALYANVCA